MKSKNPSFPRKRGGFTLVELLVVIAIIALLASLAITIGPKMMAKARATESMQNMRQFGPLLTSYASENSMKLPPLEADYTMDDGSSRKLRWHEVCLRMIYPDVDPAYFADKNWWNTNKVFMKNPQFKESATPNPWQPRVPGYGFNELIVENLALNADRPVPTEEQMLTESVPMASITEPGRTPMVAPCDRFRYRYDHSEITGFDRGTLKEFLSEGKFPVLFVDGHIESVTPKEYISKQLYVEPRKTGT